ncbi:enoyl-[acyl-carrier-protein] reductase, mitochondrial [Trifolium repens]|nr:enoyl-[acyl-carrier-protein] reductase, mitochondrial [Trifolium repens]
MEGSPMPKDLLSQIESDFLSEFEHAEELAKTIEPGTKHGRAVYLNLHWDLTVLVAILLLKFLRQGGTMVTYGVMSKKPVTVSTSAFIFKELSLRGFWLQNWLSTNKAQEGREMIDKLLGLVQDGKLKYKGWN